MQSRISQKGSEDEQVENCEGFDWNQIRPYLQHIEGMMSFRVKKANGGDVVLSEDAITDSMDEEEEEMNDVEKSNEISETFEVESHELESLVHEGLPMALRGEVI